MRGYLPLVYAVLVSAFLLGSLLTGIPGREASAPPPVGVPSSEAEIVQTRAIAPGERTVLTVRTTGVAEVVIFEEDAHDPSLLEEFRAGRVPRTARVFSNMKEVAYPLASQTGSTFHVRVRHLVQGDAVLEYSPGLDEQAMTQLRRGSPLVRNRGTVLVRGDLHHMPVYQLVPGTIIKVEIKAGRGTVALLKTRDYLAVRDGKATLASRCAPASCLRSAEGAVLELRVDDYDDLYLTAASDGDRVEFAYQIIATPEVLNYISTCS